MKQLLICRNEFEKAMIFRVKHKTCFIYLSVNAIQVFLILMFNFILYFCRFFASNSCKINNELQKIRKSERKYSHKSILRVFSASKSHKTGIFSLENPPKLWTNVFLCLNLQVGRCSFQRLQDLPKLKTHK